MKILHLIFSLSSGGAEKFTVDICNQLSKSNELYLCVILDESINDYSFFRNQLNDNINYINLKQTKGFSLKAFYLILKLLYSIKPDVVHSHLNTIVYLYVPSLILKSKIKFIHTLHSIANYASGLKWQKKINDFLYRNGMIHPVVISQQNKDSFIDFYQNHKVTLIENGISFPKKSMCYENVKSELNLFKKEIGDRIFIHIANFSDAKNQNLLINVFNRLISEGHNLVLVILGRGFDSDIATNLREISSEKIHFLGAKSNVYDYLLNSDVFVLSSLYEGLPISLLEAMSCGVIPVCTPAGGIPNVIINDHLGFVSPDFSESGFYDTILTCIDRMEIFDRTNLVQYCSLNFSIEKCSNQYLELYIRI